MSHAAFVPEMISERSATASWERVSGFWLLIGLLMLVAAGKVIQSDTMDPDAFWHLRVADQLLRDGLHPLVDQISFASLKTPWTPYSWLAELLMKGVWDAAGFRGAILLTAACSAAIVYFIALGCRARLTQSNDIAIALCTAVGAFFTLPFISFRPVTFALVILGAIAWLLSIDRKARTRWVWLCVPLTLLETNLHLYSVIGVIFAMLSALGSAFDDRPLLCRRTSLALAMLLAACCTPMLPGAIATALHYNAADPMVASNFITEMRPFYTGGTGHISLAIVVLIAVLCVWQRKSLSVTDWLWLGLSLVLLFRLGRFSPVFAIIAMPIATRSLPFLGGSALRKPIVKIALIGVIGAGITSVASAYPWDASFDAWLNRNNATYPTAAADFMDAQIIPREHQLINEFNWGGYLAWRLGDRYQVLMDGRTQLYAPAFWYQTHLGNTAARTAFLKTVRADAAILPTHDSAFEAVLIQLNWSIAYRDDLSIVLIPPTAIPHTAQ